MIVSVKSPPKITHKVFRPLERKRAIAFALEKENVNKFRAMREWHIDDATYYVVEYYR